MPHKNAQRTLAIALSVLMLFCSLPAGAAVDLAPPPPGVDELPWVYELPNLFQFNNGAPLTTLDQWQARQQGVATGLGATADVLGTKRVIVLRVYFNDFSGEEVKTYERRIAKDAFEAGWRYAVKHACAGEK